MIPTGALSCIPIPNPKHRAWLRNNCQIWVAHGAPNNIAVCNIIATIKVTLVPHTQVVIVSTGAMNWAILRERPPTKAKSRSDATGNVSVAK